MLPVIVLDIPLKIYKKIEKISVKRTIKEAKLISLSEVLLPVLEKEFN